MKIDDLAKHSLCIEALLKLSHVDYKKLSNTDQNILWNHAYIDSTKVTDGGLFIGLQGEHRNGGEFLKEAIEQGAVCALIEKKFENNIDLQVFKRPINVYIVEHALEALVLMAKSIRSIVKSKVKFIGITGSAGKTTSKHILSTLLDAYKGSVCSQGNLNTVQGMALCLINTVWLHASYGVFECGISQFGEMEKLIDILDPDYAVITNVNYAHIGGYKNIIQLRQEKLKIATNMTSNSVLWLPEDDEILLESARNMNFACAIKTYGIESTQGLISYKDKGTDGLSIKIDGIEIAIPLIGYVNVLNALLAIEVLRYFGMSISDISHTLSKIKGVDGRYQVLKQTPLIIDDSYNSSPDALNKSIVWISQLNYKNKILILGAMRELGEKTQEMHAKILDELYKYKFSLVILIGKEFNDFKIKYDNYVQIANNDEAQRKKLINMLLSHISQFRDSETILFFKGSRFYQIDTIAQMLVNHISEGRGTHD